MSPLCSYLFLYVCIVFFFWALHLGGSYSCMLYVVRMCIKNMACCLLDEKLNVDRMCIAIAYEGLCVAKVCFHMSDNNPKYNGWDQILVLHVGICPPPPRLLLSKGITARKMAPSHSTKAPLVHMAHDAPDASIGWEAIGLVLGHCQVLKKCRSRQKHLQSPLSEHTPTVFLRQKW